MRSCENDPVHARHNCLLCELCTPQGCQSPNAFANGRTSSNCGTLFDYYAGSVSRDQDSSRPYCGAFSGLGMLDADCFAIQTLGVGGYLQRFIMLITDLLRMGNRSCGIVMHTTVLSTGSYVTRLLTPKFPPHNKAFPNVYQDLCPHRQQGVMRKTTTRALHHVDLPTKPCFTLRTVFTTQLPPAALFVWLHSILS